MGDCADPCTAHPTGNSRYEIPDTQVADEKQLEVLQDRANFRSFKPKPFNMREFYDRAGHDIRDMLLSCHFRGEVCSAEDFKVVSEPLCWRMGFCPHPSQAVPPAQGLLF